MIQPNMILGCHPILKTDFVRAEGSTIYDSQGRGFLDLESGVWCTCLGHSHPRIMEAIRRQAGQVTHLGFRYLSPVIEEAAANLLDLTGMAGGKCLFLTSGSEAVNLALNLAKIATHKTRLVCLEPTFLSSYGEGANQSASHWTQVERDASSPGPNTNWDQVAAFVLEPGSACGSIQFPSKALVSGMADLVHRHGGLVVVDEVVTGFGRSGQWFGFNHFGIHPDIVAVGKGLGNGYPVSAVIVSPRVAEAVEAAGLHYIQSHQNDPLGCAVALEVVRTLSDEGLINRSRDVGRALLDQLTAIGPLYPAIRAVRGKGLMVAVEFHERLKAGLVFARMLARGFLVGCSPGYNVIRFMPALTIQPQEIQALIGNLEQVLTEIGKGYDSPGSLGQAIE
jgi:acetylornithine/N-succinyldiaminopimelate aminotransferase